MSQDGGRVDTHLSEFPNCQSIDFAHSRFSLSLWWWIRFKETCIECGRFYLFSLILTYSRSEQSSISVHFLGWSPFHSPCLRAMQRKPWRISSGRFRSKKDIFTRKLHHAGEIQRYSRGTSPPWSCVTRWLRKAKTNICRHTALNLEISGLTANVILCTNDSWVHFPGVLYCFRSPLEWEESWREMNERVLWRDESIMTGIVNRLIEPIPSAILTSDSTRVAARHVREISASNKRFSHRQLFSYQLRLNEHVQREDVLPCFEFVCVFRTYRASPFIYRDRERENVDVSLQFHPDTNWITRQNVWGLVEVDRAYQAREINRHRLFSIRHCHPKRISEKLNKALIENIHRHIRW